MAGGVHVLKMVKGSVSLLCANFGGLAAQTALFTWQTLLLGMKFEIYSGHDSLQYLFTKKSLSQRILRFSIQCHLTGLKLRNPRYQLS